MNPIVAIASFCPACCCTVDSWTLMNGLIIFSSPEGQRIWDLRFSQWCFWRSKVFCDVLLCPSLRGASHFEGSLCLHLQGQAVQEHGLTLKMNELWSLKLRATHPTTKHHISEKLIFSLTMYYYLMKWQNNLNQTHAYNLVILGV